MTWRQISNDDFRSLINSLSEPELKIETMGVIRNGKVIVINSCRRVTPNWIANPGTPGMALARAMKKARAENLIS